MPDTEISPKKLILRAAWLNSPLGVILAIADEKKLYLLEFIERLGLEREIESLTIAMKATLALGYTAPIASIESELKRYFNGSLKKFQTPLQIFGSPFQKLAWQAIINIPYGETISYAAQAAAIKKPTACRAVANANGCNQFAIVIPCHRIINNNGKLGGYGGGIARKKWLIYHEAINSCK